MDQKSIRTFVSCGRKFKIETIDEENIPHFDLVFFSTGDDLSYKYAPLFIKNSAADEFSFL